MLQNYLKIAFRNLLRERLYSVINILGLAVGVAVALLILLYVRHEWSYDTFHSKEDRLYRAWVKEHLEGEVYFNTTTPVILGEVLKENFAEVEAVAQYLIMNNLVKKEAFISQEPLHLANAGFLQAFDFEILEGSPEEALDGLRKVALTPSVARKYFGEEEALGESLSIQLGGQWEEFVVSGIIAEAPPNSSIQYGMLIPFDNLRSIFPASAMTSWTFVYPETYVLLRENADLRSLEVKLSPIIDEQVARIYDAGDYVVGLQPLADIHLNTDYPAGWAAVSDWRYPYILSGIAVLILLLAGINYVTLAVGRSVSRAKEVGIRKVAGARRRQVMQQFWSEAVVIATLAVAAGALLARLVLPAFNRLADKNLTLSFSPAKLLLLSVGALLIGLVAGAYPAIIVSGFSPMRAIKGYTSKLGRGKSLVLRGLVSFQFVLSLVLILCAFAMQSQLRFLQNKNLGFDKEQTLILPFEAARSNEYTFTDILENARQVEERLRQELNGVQEVGELSSAVHALGTAGWMELGFQDPATQKLRHFHFNAVNYNFLPTMGIELKAGRHFSREMAGDAGRAVIANETMIRQFGWEAFLGQPLPPPFQEMELVGIVEDFHYNSLHTRIEPLLMAINLTPMLDIITDMNFGDTPIPKLAVKLKGNELLRTVGTIKAAWREVAPEQPFNYTFVDQAIDEQYRAEQRLGIVVAWATALAIFIACLGLFGIATLTVAQRRKEVGVRKVLGASLAQVVVTLNKRTTIMVLVSSLIAAPLALLLMYSWLQDFAYRVPISPWWFVGATGIAVLFAWLSVSSQSLRAAMANPVEALRSE